MRFLILFFVLYWPIAQAQQIDVGSPDVNLQIYYLSDGKLKGMVGEKFQCLLDQSGLPINLMVLPNKRLLYWLESGRLPLVVGMVKTPRRLKSASYLAVDGSQFFKIASAEKAYQSIDDLQHATVALLRKSSYYQQLKLRGIEMLEVETFQQALEVVKAGRVDAAIIPHDENFDQQQSDLIFSPLPRISIGMYISKRAENHDQLLTLFTEASEQCGISEQIEAQEDD